MGYSEKNKGLKSQCGIIALKMRKFLQGVNYLAFIFIGLCFGLVSYIGDDYCDDNSNNPECNYDGGDCCGPNVNTLYCQECLCLNDSTTLSPTTGNPAYTTTPATTTSYFASTTDNSGITSAGTLKIIAEELQSKLAF